MANIRMNGSHICDPPHIHSCWSEQLVFSSTYIANRISQLSHERRMWSCTHPRWCSHQTFPQIVKLLRQKRQMVLPWNQHGEFKLLAESKPNNTHTLKVSLQFCRSKLAAVKKQTYLLHVNSCINPSTVLFSVELPYVSSTLKQWLFM
jgi:hypothetical protein